MTNTRPQTLAETRSYSTDEERTVLALETIADQLRSLVEVSRPVTDPEPTNEPAAIDPALRSAESWENEGASLSVDIANSYGIKHSVIDQYEIGGYRYSKLEDAVAEAKRSAALKSRLISKISH